MEVKKYTDEEYVKAIFEKVYPIGSIYISMNNTNPSDLFGFGEWEQIKDTFLLASGEYSSVGSIGGAENHTLTINEIPAHKHYQSFPLSVNGELDSRPAVVNVHSEYTDSTLVSRGSYKNYKAMEINGTASEMPGYPITGLATGGGQPFSIMPPYLSVNIWRRIS